MKSQTTIVAGDLHYPFHDRRTWPVFLDFVKYVQPDFLILLGDVADFYAISSFDKDPMRSGRLMTEIEGLGEEILQPLAKAAGKATKFIIPGNHEDRLRRFIWKKAPELHGMTLELSEIFRCADLKFIMAPKKITLGKLEVMHGSFLSQHSAWTGKLHVDRFGGSILVGHSHRLGFFAKTDMRGPHGGWEIGCLCDLEPEYVDFPNWQQGWAVVTTWPNGFFNVQLVPVINRTTVMYGKKVWGNG